MTTLVIVNPKAGSGRAGKLWNQIEPLMWKELGDLMIAVTQSPQEVAQQVELAHLAGIKRVIAIGGDGTTHALVNELVHLNQRYPGSPPMTFGQLPIGTGQDFARSIGVPLKPEEAVRWIASAHPAPIDVGQLRTDTGFECYFLNIASVGMSGMIMERINRIKNRRPWTYHRKVVEAFVIYNPNTISVKLDGKLWYEGKSYLVAIANGREFGHGMRIAPDASYDDGLFDVVLVEGLPRLEAIVMMNTVYTGAHLKRHDVHVKRARVVEIEGGDKILGMEIDGEHNSGRSFRFEALHEALTMLVGGK